MSNELFDFPEFEITNKIRLIELFGGIGSQAMALRDIGADFEHYRLVEFDKYPVASYNAIHGTNFEPTDITKIHGNDLGIVDTDKYTYIMTYSFPCQDLSLAGKRRGMTKGSGTRSGLLWEVERLLRETPEVPQVLLMENVPQVISEKNKADFDDWLDFLKSKGYQNYYKVLNAKDYGIAQNRERCFMVSLHSSQWYDFQFPAPVKLTTTVKDYLEDEVDEKFYINNEKAKKLIRDLIERGELPEQNRTEQNRTEQNRTEQSTGQEWTCQPTQTESRVPQTVLQLGTTPESVNTQASEQELSRDVVYMNYRRIDKKSVDVAKTLCARDYKGYGTGFDTMNGVIEREN